MKDRIGFLLCLLAFLPIYGSVDFEQNIQQFVKETKKIEIPGYPIALNPSIIRWKGKLLMSFRVIPEDRKRKYESDIGLVWLDEEYNAISIPQILDLRPCHIDPVRPSRAADARLIKVGKELHLIYDDNRDEKLSKGGFRMYVAKLDFDGFNALPKEVDVITKFEGESKNLREKSWVPFEYQNELLMAYSLSPHRIFRYLGCGECETFAETYPEYEWDYGVLRGGTPGLNIDNKFYLSFFHSSIKMKSLHSYDEDILHYFMGAYTFSLEPPFEVLQISPDPIVGPQFYHGKQYTPYWHPLRVVFPAGFICERNTISVVYGRQDHELWVVKIDKCGLLNSLIPVKSGK